MRADVQLEVEQDLAADEEDHQEDGASERHDGKGAEQDGDVEDDNAPVGSHHDKGNGGAFVFSFADVVGCKGKEMTKGESQSGPASSVGDDYSEEIGKAA